MCKRLVSGIFLAMLLSLALPIPVRAELVARWKFDDGAGTTAVDSRRNGNDGTLQGGAQWVSGQIGGAIQFNGTDSYVAAPHIPLDKRSFTVAMWVNPVLYTAQQTIFSQHETGSANLSMHFRLGGPGGTAPNPGAVRMGFYSNDLDTPAGTVQDNTWYHLTFWYDYPSQTQRIYVNGVQAGQRSAAPYQGTSGETRIGQRNSSEWFQGIIDDVQVYDESLTASQITAVMQGIKGYPVAARPDPANGVTVAATWASLNWKPGDLAASHDVYFGDNFADVNAGTGGTFRGNQPQASTSYFVGLGLPGDPYPNGLSFGATYYWRIDEVNEADPSSPWKGPVWSFSVASRIASAPKPADGAKFVSEDVKLSWTAGPNAKLHYVYFGDSFDTVSNATQGGTPAATTSFTPPGPLVKGKTYYWRVDEFDGTTTYKGDVWTLTIIPDISVTDPNLIGWWKLDEGEGTRAVDWSGHGNHGELRGDPQWVNGYDGGALDFDGAGDFIFTGKSASSLGIGGNRPRTVTAWVYTRAFNSGGIFDVGNRSATQDFCLRTLGSANQWRIQYWGGDSDFTYPSQNVWVHFAHVHDGARTRVYANGALIVDWDKTINTADTNPFQIGAYGWQVNFFNGLIDDVHLFNKVLTPEDIQVVMRGDPMRASNPSPANGSVTDVARASTLSWLPGNAAAQHAVYFGTDMAAVAGADASDTTGIYRGVQTAVSYTLPDALAWASGPYYWRVDELAADGTVVKGSIWSFSVPDYVVVDDFETYNDIATGQAGSNLVYETWLDGYGTTTNGSTMGYTTPFAPTMQTSVVHSGKQSAPMTYNNTAAGLSEVTSTFAAENWTAHGVQSLSLWFYGDPNNTPGQLYVKINGKKVAYDGEAVNLTLRRWQTWNIDLASVGVNLQSVTSMAVGIEGAGAKGTVLLDDIRLYPYTRQLITPVQPDPNGLVAHYPFEGNANDVAGTNNGTLSGGPVFAIGQIGQAIQLDGVDDYVDCGTGAALNIQDTITLSCWIKVAAFTKSWEAILAKGDNSYRISRSATTGNSVHFGCNGPTGGNLDAKGIVTDNNWHHVACVYDGVNKIIYIDGREDARVASTGQIALSTFPLWIGNNSGSAARQLGGLVDDVRIYGRALSDAEVAGLAGRTLPHEKPF